MTWTDWSASTCATRAAHDVDPGAGVVSTMAHHVMVVGGFRDKIRATVLTLVRSNPRAIVFTRTRQGATDLRDTLSAEGVQAVDLHGNLSQQLRERNLARFSDGRAQAVVATDVAARGIHVDNVGIVIHFDPPNDPKAYLHRSGRTARAGESGAVVTVVTPRQLGSVVAMQRQSGVTARHHDLRTAPEELSAEVLATSGTEAPTERAASRKPAYQSRSPRQRPNGKGTGARRHERRSPQSSERGRGGSRATSSSAPQRPERTPRHKPEGTKAAPRRTGKKARWTQSDRDRRG